MFKAKAGSPERHLDSALSKAEEQKLRPPMDLASALRETTFLFLRFTPTLSATSHISYHLGINVSTAKKLGVGIVTFQYVPILESIFERSIDSNILCVKLL